MKNLRQNIVSIFMCWMASMTFMTSAHAKAPVPLAPEDAFQLSVSYVRPNTLMAEWHIAKGYYLYVKRIKISFTPASDVAIDLPQGELHAGPDGESDEVYKGNVSVPLTLSSNSPPTTVSIDYQGCSAKGFCYPPMNKTFMIDAINSKVFETAGMDETVKAAPTIQSLLTDQNDIDTILKNQNFGVLLLIFLGLGLLLAFTPCVLPMVPILTSIIVGQKHAPHSRQAFFLSLSYVLGMALTYAFAGVLVASLGGSVQVWLQKPATIIIVSFLFMFLALSLFGLYELRFSRRWHNKINNWSNKHEGGTYAGVFFMGVLSTLVVSPCITAPLVGVLLYIGQTGDLWLGGSALFAMGVGMGIPLLVIGMSAGKWLPKSGPWMKAIKELFGIFMVAMAIWLLSRIMPAYLTQILFGVLLLGTALFIGVYLPKLVRMREINRLIGLGTAMFGLFMVYNGINLTMQSAPLTQQNKSQNAFIVVHNLTDLNKYLAEAKAINQPVILDFYADWCTSCVDMDKKVFSKADVKQILTNFKLLRVDLSQNSKSESELLKHFAVIAPPTILFFNNTGHEVNTRRIVGELSPTEFMTRIDSFITASCDKKIQC